MVYEVRITERAETDLDQALGYLAANSPAAAARWYSKLLALLQALSEMPQRFPLIPAAERLHIPYRSCRHYSHSVIFRVDDNAGIVYVVRVYHQARKPITGMDLPDEDRST